VADPPVVAGSEPIPTPAPAAGVVADPQAPQGDKPARKRRRRRHGRPLEGEGATPKVASTGNGQGDATAAAHPPRAGGAVPPKARPEQAPAAHPNDSFLTRLGRKIKSLVGG
jgi:ATP-dependent RNA helicase RhlB